MDNLKCLSDHVYAHASVDFIDACETLRKELLKSMKIAKKFKEELKLANKSTTREHNKSIFVPTCHLCGVVGHIRPKCSLLKGILMFLNLFLFVIFVVSSVTFVLIVIN